jgi:hypothetical protein
MQTKVNREELLNCLQSITPGLSKKPIIEQSNAFVFQNGLILTYNDEIACRIPSPIGKAVTGAVKAEKLLELIGKLPDEKLHIDATDEELLITSNRIKTIDGKKQDVPGDRESGVLLEKEIMLPIDQVDKTTTWTKLHPDFSEAVRTVQYSAGTDQSTVTVFLHIHPDWVEATDDEQICRWKLKTGFSQPTLVRQSSIKHITSLGLDEFCETKEWIHFRHSESKLVLACRRYLEKYPVLDTILNQEVKTSDITFPKGLVQETDLADIFSSENADGNWVTVNLMPDKIKVVGKGSSGWLRGKSKPIDYKGKATTFRIAPQLLVEVINKYPACLIASDRLRVEGRISKKSGQPRFVYLTRISPPRDEENGEAEPKKKTKKKVKRDED